MSRVKNLIDKLLLSVSIILLIAMVALSTWQVLARYVFNISSPGTEETIRYLLIWFSLFSAAYVFGEKKHIAILFFKEKLGIKSQRIMERITDILIIVLAAVLMVYGGIKIVLLTVSQTAAATGISMAMVYAALPVSGFFIILFTFLNMRTNDVNEGEEVIKQ
ncbi:TRAP transporter small permease [Bacillus massiliglaciei]|uniref:TRAP transporter small permease n=1 Tax=Bacillus massiliglaciei TaxID=1816693 RepID=UPI000B057D13|nr:TRAP transporter small permease [Bacillus massiliglaciei]